MSSERQKEIVYIYKKTKSYAITGRILNISTQCVHRYVKDYFNTGKKRRFGKYEKKLFGKKCAVCKKLFANFLHHIDFDNKNDNINNLQPVCKDCHYLIHELHRKGRGFKKHNRCKRCKKLFTLNFKHFIKGLCKNCYYPYIVRERRGHKKIKTYRKCRGCKRKFTKELKVRNVGLCKQCYRRRRWKNPEYRKYHKEYYKKYYERKREILD